MALSHFATLMLAQLLLQCLYHLQYVHTDLQLIVFCKLSDAWCSAELHL